ncbi:hypothetical protein BN8_02607 [Fibrisoma limi BUZ 3]|uniref:Capsule assembly protein Wzi n=1 Tax=Fibrisoma limi BUZ 3 TaxID=1185876 RepID=I2GHY3_9BACT|nr:capsule assembly Wzi family protein [Fibrisoma limi]CCH53508.1 hypothetical protein BN8_02607 [Fibrisoma limi BUZ 3]
MQLTVLFSISLLTVTTLHAQVDTLSAGRHQAQYRIEVGGLAASTTRTPFWLRANQYGIVPANSPGGLFIVGANGRIGREIPTRKLQLTYGLEAVGVFSKSSKVLLPEAYVSAQLGKFYVYGGRRKEIIGLGDSTLSSGFYSWSQNALPMTKIQIGTNGFVPLGFTNGLIAINAFYSHGWFPDTDSIRNSYLHQKVLFGRIGKPTWKVKLYGGMVYNAQWGGESRYLGNGASKNGKLPSSFDDYLSVVIGRQPTQQADNDITTHDALNRVGNHVGSIDIGAEFELKKWTLLLYDQHPFEDKSGLTLYNLTDGLYGARLKRQPTSEIESFQITQILFEYLTTLNQSGARLPTGQDDYFNNFQYIDGWTRSRQVIGNPFISPRMDVRPEVLPTQSRYKLFVANNRVQVVHMGLAGVSASGVSAQIKLSYSRNYGIYRAPFEKAVNQFSGLLAATWPLRWLGDTELNSAIAIDYGNLYSNTSGVWISIRKRFMNGSSSTTRH